ncbi:MAG: efflux RND transporter periplasmic adaptor subunit [Acidobacteria bacterium]|nr:MAG: efflux RND transporter periplasmic adaptor subunit [Acidobacteriota bacterium]
MFLMFVLALLIAGCSANKAAPPAQPPQPAPVFVSKAVLKSVPIEIQAIGNVEAYSTVLVKAQVGGELTVVDFKEGADVKRGDRLFVIDPRPYESQVAQAEATLAKDRAQLQSAQANLARDMAQEEYARAQAKRYAELSRQGVLAKDSAEQTDAQAKAAAEGVRADRAAIESTQANIASDQAALDRAKLQLEYCTIRSPIDGRTGHLMVKQGNVIKANDVDLVTINQMHPIYVTFSVPEANLSLIKKHMAAGDIAVAASLQGADAVAERGTLSFVENAVDSATGTIRLKAIFDNAATRLWPGQFVRVVVRLKASADSIVVPTTAVQTGQDGKFVFVVKPDMIVDARPVLTGRTIEREVVIEKGLSEGDTVVTSGQLRLVSGSRVQIKLESSPAGP